MRGSRVIRSAYDRKSYWFSGPAEKRKFDANPTRYVPVLGGDCPVAKVDEGVFNAGSVKFFVKRDDRLFFVGSKKHRQALKANPADYADVDLAYAGYSPVPYVDGKFEEGKPELTTVYDSHRYRFADTDQQRTFESDPMRYVPVLGGDCAVTWKDEGKRRAGRLRHGAYYGGRLFLFVGDEQYRRFFADPEKYANADLAAAGVCVVSRKLLGLDVPGAEANKSLYRGMRYLFRGRGEKRIFEADPARFAVPAKSP